MSNRKCPRCGECKPLDMFPSGYQKAYCLKCFCEITASRKLDGNRIKALSRDGNQCRLCGSTNNLIVHHIIPRTRGGDNTLTNLITLCRKCHLSHGHLKCFSNYNQELRLLV